MGSKKQQTVGYKYYAGMHLVFCHGPVDKINQYYVDDDRKVIATGLSASGPVVVNQPNLFGGEDSGGGMSGTLDQLMGESTQVQNSYLLSKLGALLPAYRGVVSAVLRQMYVGMSPYLKTIGISATRIHKSHGGGAQWYDEKAEIFAAGEEQETYSEDFQVDATQAGTIVSGHATAVIEGVDPTDVLTITKPAGLHYQGWSAWDTDGNNGGNSWTNRFEVTYGDEAGPHTTHWSTFHPTAAAAEAAAAGLSVELTGYSKYIIWIFDAPVTDNRGGLSIRVERQGFVTTRSDMNPAHIIRECLTNPDWGMGYAEADIDDDAFRAAADTLFDEHMGISLLWDSSQAIEDFVSTICKHIDASIYVDRHTGRFVLKLIRNDYDEGSLLELDTSNVLGITDYSKPTFGELTNSVTVTYWDGASRGNATVTVSDIALASAQGATINTAVEYPGFTNGLTASRVAQRDLISLSSPRVSCTVTANRVAKNLAPGMCFKLTWPDLEMEELVMRVTGIAFGDGKTNQVRISCTQDVFATPAEAIIVPSVPVIPSTADPEPATLRMAIEMPYWEAVQRYDQSQVDSKLAGNPDVGFVLAAAARPTSNSINAQLWTNPGTGYAQATGVLDFCPFAELDGGIDREVSEFAIGNINELTTALVGTWLLCGDEIMQVVDWDDHYLMLTVRRGCLDTVPALHDNGTPLLFADSYSETDSVEYVSGETIGVKILPRTSSAVLVLADAPEDQVFMASRGIRPYPPANVRVDGELWPDFTEDDVIELTWNTRNRVAQTGTTMLGWYDGSVAEESGVRYGVRVIDRDTDSIVFEDLNITASPYTLAVLVSNMQLQVLTIRDGYECWQPVVIDMEAAAALLTEAGESVLTEAGEFILVEGIVNAIVAYNLNVVAVWDGKVFAFKNRVTSADRLYTSLDNGATYESVAYPFAGPTWLHMISSGIWNVFANLDSGDYCSIGVSTAGTEEAWQITSTLTDPAGDVAMVGSTATGNMGTDGYPRTSADVFVFTRAFGSDGTNYYLIGNYLASSDLHVFRAGADMVLTDLGIISQAASDPNSLQGSGALQDTYVLFSNFIYQSSGGSGVQLIKFGTRWFLSSLSAIYYNDDIEDLDGWYRCPTGLGESTTTPPILLLNPIQVGTTILAFDGRTNMRGISKSEDGGETWTLVLGGGVINYGDLRDPIVLGSQAVVRDGLNSLMASAPFTTWTAYPRSGYTGSFYRLLTTGSSLVGASTSGQLFYSTDGYTFAPSQPA